MGYIFAFEVRLIRFMTITLFRSLARGTFYRPEDGGPGRCRRLGRPQLLIERHADRKFIPLIFLKNSF